ncbi:MAG: fasciclin domain-containing protein [Phycisphaeraceae bacterium]|nr:fasciclin domain-containing protein [Phycisphaeraceae bacterium]
MTLLRNSLVAVGTSALVATIAHAQCSGGSTMASAPKAPVAMGAVGGSSDIVDTAVAAGNFKTLAAALEAAELIDTLKGAGPFTVFAPTDDAFAKLPKETLESLLKPENKAKLAAILTYHVVPGNADASTVLSRPAWATVNGQRINITQKDGTAMVNGAKITATDIRTSNGTIHVIDTVILPSQSNLVQTAVDAKFNTLAQLVTAAGLVDTLSGKDSFTVFAPTDEAFAKLPPETIASLLRPENKAELVKILTFHVVPGRVYSNEAIAARNAPTVQGERISITQRDGKVMINNATVTKADIEATNGVIHVIDTVILPK